MIKIVYIILIVPFVFYVVPRFVGEHILAAGLALFAGPFVGIFVCLIYNRIWMNNIFADNPEVAYILKLETSGNIFDYKPMAVTFALFVFISALLAFIIDPLRYRKKGDTVMHHFITKGMKNTVLFYVGLFAIIALVYFTSDSTPSDKAQKYCNDFELYSNHEIVVDSGTISSDPHINFITVDGLEYIGFVGTDGEKHCLHASAKQLENVDFSEGCLYTVSYLPNTKILVDITGDGPNATGSVPLP